jgi:hypothetical protein
MADSVRPSVFWIKQKKQKPLTKIQKLELEIKQLKETIANMKVVDIREYTRNDEVEGGMHY